MNENTPSYKKRIIYRYTTPLFTFVKKDDFCELRTKSAPPLNTIEEKKEQKKYVLCKPDGTPLSIEDLSDISDSEESSNEQEVKDKIKPEKDLDSNKNMTSIENLENISCIKCDNCAANDAKREKILNELLEMYKEKETTLYTFKPSILPQIIYSVEDILDCKEVKPFTIKLLLRNIRKVPVNYKEFKLGKETILEKANFELNKLTSTNIKKIINNLRQLDLQTIDQAKYIGNLVVFKAINEPQYCYQYAMVVGALKKDFKSQEEKSLNKSQTAFFGTVLTSSMKILEEKIQWSDKVILDRNNYKNTFEYEKAFEEQETERYTKKKKTLGAVDFLCNLYNLDIITLKHIKVRLDEFLQIENEEIIEVLGRFIDKIGEKMTLNEKSDYANMICNYLYKNKDKYVNRVKFFIMDVIDRKSKWKKPVNKTGNTFALLEVEDDVPVQNVEEKIESEDIELKISEILSDTYMELDCDLDEEEEVSISDNLTMASNTYGKIPFYTFYILNCLTNAKRCKILGTFFSKHFLDTGLSKEDIFEILSQHKNNLDDLKKEYPLSVKNYIALLNLFKEGNVIEEDAYDKLIVDG